MTASLLTLSEQFFRDQAATPGATGELSTILNRISLAARIIANEVMRAGLHNRLGYTGGVNVQDEEQRELDVIANDVFTNVFERIDVVCGMASEEMDDIHHFEDKDGKYVILHDPLDGSGNVDINGSMGTIFSVHRRVSDGGRVDDRDFLRKGSEQVAAGYVLYGPSTFFVYSSGGPVHGFTLDRSVGTFYLTHPNLTFAEGSGSYAINEANQAKWDERTQRMVEAFRTGEARVGKRSARYVGALVADFHRTLIQGGIYMYPGEVKKPEGKLRLLYEAAPLAFIAKQAGGDATDGRISILDVEPDKLHFRTPLFIGAKSDVAEAMRLLND